MDSRWGGIGHTLITLGLFSELGEVDGIFAGLRHLGHNEYEMKQRV